MNIIFEKSLKKQFKNYRKIKIMLLIKNTKAFGTCPSMIVAVFVRLAAAPHGQYD